MKTWRERIAEARGFRGLFTDEDYDLANGWDTCAVGEQAAALPTVVFLSRDDIGPTDGQLFEYGMAFLDAIVERNPDRAERYLDRIEDRVLQLKREQPT